MHSLSNLWGALSGIAILGAFLAVWIVYEKFERDKDGNERSFVLCLVGALLGGLSGVAVGGFLIVSLLCTAASGVGCVVIPLLAFPFTGAVGVGIFLWLWASGGQQEQQNG